MLAILLLSISSICAKILFKFGLFSIITRRCLSLVDGTAIIVVACILWRQSFSALRRVNCLRICGRNKVKTGEGVSQTLAFVRNFNWIEGLI